MAMIEATRCLIATSHVKPRFGDERRSILVVGSRRRTKDRVRVEASNSSGEDGRASSSGELSGQEYFESFLRRRQANGDFVSRATDVLWNNEAVGLDDESRLQVQEKLASLQKMKEVEDNGSYLRLSQARNWSLGQDVAPINPNNAALERERVMEDRKKQSLLEYEALKRELLVMTSTVAVGVSAYCFITLSLEATVSYGIGAFASLGYLQLLYRHVDEVGEENVAQVFVQRRRKRIGITSTDLQESFQKTIYGSSRALSSPRLVLPAILFGLWALTSHAGEKSPIHLEVAPLLFGFFAYKAAALLQAFRDNKDLVFSFANPKSPENR